MDIRTWLGGELAAVEAAQQGHAPVCALDRRGATPPALKRLEGRGFVLRRALRLLERGEGLGRLHDEGKKARAFLGHAESDGPGGPSPALAGNALWLAYFEAVAEAVDEVLARAEPGLKP